MGDTLSIGGADVDVAALADAARAKGLPPDAVQAYAAQHGITADAAARVVLGGDTVSKLADAWRRVEQTYDKGKAVLADTEKGAALGGAIGTVFGPEGTAIGGAVGAAAGAVYGVIDNFGGDIVDFASGLFGGGPAPVCLDFFRRSGSCDNIDRRMNNVAKLQRAVRADTALLARADAELAKQFDVEPAYAAELLALERARNAKLDANALAADHVLHANPRFILGQVPAFGITLRGPEDIVRTFKVRPEFADQMLSAAGKLVKAPPPAKANPNAPKLLALTKSSVATSAAAVRGPSLDEFVAFYLGGGPRPGVAPPPVDPAFAPATAPPVPAAVVKALSTSNVTSLLGKMGAKKP